MTILDHDIAEAPLHGFTESGDRAVVIEVGDVALVGAIDGLGHGPEASVAADAALRALEEAPDAPLVELIARCHDRLRETRGVAMSLARIDAARASMSWIGVGNVEGVLVRALAGGAAGDESLTSRGGIVGYRLPPLQLRTHAIHPADTLVLATDGIKLGFRREVTPVRDLHQIAASIIDRWASGKDDACVVVARFRGERSEGTRIDVDDETGVHEARIRARDQARALGFSAADVEAIATAVSELARNILQHASTGDIVLVPVHDGARHGLAVMARDRGPGIADVSLALQDGYSTRDSLGYGLPGARRLVDELHVDTELGVGTIVTIKKWLR
ncbi:MAG: ATP-binding protein [Acidobacteriota bacterium]